MSAAVIAADLFLPTACAAGAGVEPHFDGSFHA
jgi:hypothetical protein